MDSITSEINEQDFETLKSKYGLKWHKFQIYFVLWASALSYFSSGYKLINGAHYEGDAPYIYAVYPALKSTDLVAGILLILLGAAAIYVRFQLADFKKGAIGKLTKLYIADIVIGTIYVIAFFAIVRQNPFDSISDFVGSIIGSVIVMIINISYYRNRDELFIN